uniref:Phosphatidylserine lipase ABHD16A n=1 Tax=Molossus molossus TaxID=27622 RepID=A0A7J8GN18_MOLMO|nr:abhydrolase domain containing 16A, phospholipase [Molossus molossus]
MLERCSCCWQVWPASEASAAGPTPSTGSSSLSWRPHIGTSLQRTRGSSPATTLTSGAGQLTSTGKSPAPERSPEGALPAGVWPSSARSPCTGGQQTPSSTGSRSCCEGNAGFYEVGCVSTPLEAGYSVLGWNHPGFAGSTGVPFPQNEANAMDVVVQFAIHRLGFQPQDIILYAWSIGGFTATWAAMSYPDISAVILDASFDDLVPLALKVMPESWRGLVTRTVRQHLNLNNSEQLCRYQGPVLLIRRTKDEIITTTVPEDIMSNRGNDLLLKLLQHRYPRVMAEEGLRVVKQWLEASSQLEEASIYSRWEVEEDWCLSVLRSYQAEHGPDFPWSVGEDVSVHGRQQLALFLAQKHLHNFEATHCTPLPVQYFQMPWHL